MVIPEELNCCRSAGRDGCVTASDSDLIGSHYSTMAQGKMSDGKLP